MFTQAVLHEDPRTDHELAQAWLHSGSEAAARELVRRLHPRVASIVRGHLPSRESIEDLVQEAFMRAFDYLPRYDFRLPLEHWISRITLNVCRNRFRHESSRPELRAADLGEAEQEVLLGDISALDHSDANARKAAANALLEHILDQLAPDDRLVLSLFELEGRTAAEVAARTGWSVLNVRMRAFRARRKATQIAATLRDELDL